LFVASTKNQSRRTSSDLAEKVFIILDSSWEYFQAVCDILSLILARRTASYEGSAKGAKFYSTDIRNATNLNSLRQIQQSFCRAKKFF
jgi:hypothetical protein